VDFSMPGFIWSSIGLLTATVKSGNRDAFVPGAVFAGGGLLLDERRSPGKYFKSDSFDYNCSYDYPKKKFVGLMEVWMQPVNKTIFSGHTNYLVIFYYNYEKQKITLFMVKSTPKWSLFGDNAK
jgi:hypothetical protein